MTRLKDRPCGTHSSSCRERRPVATKIRHTKDGISILKRGKVVYRVKTYADLEAFLRGFDPALAARMADAVSGRAEARIQRLLGA